MSSDSTFLRSSFLLLANGLQEVRLIFFHDKSYPQGGVTLCGTSRDRFACDAFYVNISTLPRVLTDEVQLDVSIGLESSMLAPTIDLAYGPRLLRKKLATKRLNRGRQIPRCDLYHAAPC